MQLKFILLAYLFVTSLAGFSQTPSAKYLNDTVNINGWVGENVSQAAFVSADSFLIRHPYLKMISCQLVIAPREGDPYVARINGNHLNRHEDWLRKLKVGDRVIVDMIMGQKDNGDTIRIKPIVYIITD